MSEPWPEIDVSRWTRTHRTLHRVLQMLGKVRLALSPTQPNWMFTALYLAPRGVTTGPIPMTHGSLELRLDVFDSSVVIERSAGERRTVAVSAARSVADVFRDVRAALSDVDASCVIDPTPQEIPDALPFDQDRTPSAYDPDAARRWFDSATSASGAFDRWRSHFFGRSGVQLWWGALDVAVILFSGTKVAPPTDRGYLMRYDLDAQLMNAGLYYGDRDTAPFFYGYIYPEPANAEHLAISPEATWSTKLHEWIVPYDTVRNAAEPEAMLRRFLDGIYAQCVNAGWNRDALSYDEPPRRTKS